MKTKPKSKSKPERMPIRLPNDEPVVLALLDEAERCNKLGKWWQECWFASNGIEEWAGCPRCRHVLMSRKVEPDAGDSGHEKDDSVL